MTRIASAFLAFCLAGPVWAGDAPAEPPPQAPPPETATRITGRVLNPEGKPVPAADVWVRWVRAKDAAEDGTTSPEKPPKKIETLVVAADDDGRFVAGDLEGRQFDVRVQATGLAPATRSQVAAGSDLEIAMQPGHSLSVLLLDLRTQKPIAGGTVLVCDAPGRVFGRQACAVATSGDDGAARLSDLPEGRHRINAVAPAHEKKRDHVVLPAPIDPDTEQPERWVALLHPGGRVAGRVVTSDGEPVEGARVVAAPQRRGYSARNAWRESRHTDEEGRFDLDGLPVSSGVRLKVTKKDFARSVGEPFDIEAGTDISDLNVTLVRGATLTVRLLDQDGQPTQADQIRLDPDSAEAPAGAETQWFNDGNMEIAAGGQHVLRHVIPGTFRLELSAPCCREYELEDLRVSEGETTDLGELVLQRGHSVSGTVTDTAGDPLAGAELNARWKNDGEYRAAATASEQDGTFTLNGLDDPAPELRLFARHDGFVQRTLEQIQPGDRDVEIVLERSGSIAGTVVAPDVAPLERFTVEAHRQGAQTYSQPRVQRFNDETGAFVLEGLDPGAYTVIARASGYAAARKTEVEVVTDVETDVGALELASGVTLRGIVVAARDQAAVPGAVVTATDSTSGTSNMFVQGHAVTAEVGLDGTFELDGLTPGTVELSATHPDYSTTEERVVLQADERPADITLELVAGGRLTGTVRDADSLPTVGATIMVYAMPPSQEPGRAITDADGRYSMERMQPGSYAVALMRASQGAARPEMKTTQIEDGETSVVDFGLDARIQLSGRLLRGDQPIPNATIMFVGAAGAMAATPTMKSASSGPDGSYSVGLDAAGTYQVMVGQGLGGEGFRALNLDVPDQPEVLRDLVLDVLTIRGVVVDPEGHPVANAAITARLDGAEGFEGFRRVTTAPDGAYEISDLSEGDHRVSVNAVGFAPAERYPVTVGADSVETIDFRLEPGLVLKGNVVDPQGSPVAGAFIMAGTSPEAARNTQTDINGAFELILDSETAVDVTALARGWAPVTLRGVVPGADPDASRVTLQVDVGGRLIVRIAGADGNPVSGIAVSIRSLDDPLGAAALMTQGGIPPTNDVGVTTAGNLSPGRYEVTVVGGRGTGAVQVVVENGRDTAVTLTVTD